jgi:hypothetical protein
MADFAKQMAKQTRELTEKEQKNAGAPIKGKMDKKHNDFMQTVIKLIDNKKIDIDDPLTFLKSDVYEKLDDEWQDRTDIALVNIADQLRLINEFYRSKETPEESPQLQTMVEQLWQMKQKIEEQHDVFKF